MIDWSIENRPLKEQSRHNIARSSRKDKKLLLIMPGNSGRDVETLRQYGVATGKSKWLVVERKKAVLDAFRQKKLLPDDQSTYHSKDLHRLQLTAIPDFVWLDLCGNLTNNDALWLKKQLPVSSQLDLFITLSGRSRSNKFFRQCLNLLSKKYKAEMEDIEKNQLKPNKLGITDAKEKRIIATHWQILQYCLPSAGIQCWIYKDGASPTMMLYHLRHFGEKKVHFAQEDFDAFLGIIDKRDQSMDEIIHAILAAQTSKEIILARTLLNDYLEASDDSDATYKKIQKCVQSIRQRQMHSIF